MGCGLRPRQVKRWASGSAFASDGHEALVGKGFSGCWCESPYAAFTVAFDSRSSARCWKRPPCFDGPSGR
jgi:hypothetical protein